MDSEIALPLAVYRFHYQAKGSLSFPEQPGVLWRSVLGKALCDAVCITRSDTCEQCLFRQQCDYTHLFVGTKPANSEIMRKYTTIPSPHVLRALPKQPLQFQNGQSVGVEVVLMGEAYQRFPVLASALHSAGLNGIGRRRVPLQLFRIEQQQADRQMRILLENGCQQEPLPASLRRSPTMPTRIIVRLLTPYKPSGKSKSNDMDITRWLMAIIRRTDLLQYFTTGIKLEADFAHLKVLAQQIQASSKSLSWQRSERYSAQRRTTKDTSGFVGNFVLDLEGYEPLWDFLWLGQWLHVGKNASMGFGRYQLSPYEKSE